MLESVINLLRENALNFKIEGFTRAKIDVDNFECTLEDLRKKLNEHGYSTKFDKEANILTYWIRS